MNSKKKADLQRKLTLAPVPRPPADLAERIKRDIPQHFTMSAESDRERIQRSLGLNMRVAASVLLVVSSAYLFMHLFERKSENVAVELPRARVATPAAKVAAPPANALRQEPSPLAALGYTSPAPAAPRPAMQMADGRVANEVEHPRVAAAERRLDEMRDREGAPGGVVGGVIGGVAGGVIRTEPPSAVAENDAAPAVPPPPAPVPAPEPPAAVADYATHVQESVTVTASAPVVEQRAAAMSASADAKGLRKASSSLVPEAQASDLELGPRGEVLGISVDPEAFERVKSAIERGEQPKGVNVEALVNYFAGRPQRTRRDVELQTEGSPAPVGAAERRAILRYTIDTATAALPPGASLPPVAADAQVHIAFESAAVASHRRIGDDQQDDTPQETLLKNESVTALYEIEMKPDVTPRQRVATVSLSYRSVADGQQRVITRTITGRDFTRPWHASSRRHRLASLGAVWGETLKDSGPAMDVALRAEELALQEPKDAKARELADVASASSRLRTSAPTGSGR